MSKILLLLRTVHQTVHQNEKLLTLKKRYSEPKIYTGGVDITLWNQLSKERQKEALSKNWYIYYKYLDSKTGKLKRMPNIKGGVNKLKTKTERIQYLTTLRDALAMLLEKGFNPYTDNDLSLLAEKPVKPLKLKPSKPEIQIVAKVETKEPEMSIREAFEFGLKIKINVLGKTSYSGYQGRINRFLDWMDATESSSNGISTLNKKTINNYLNYVLEKTSASNRNNTRTDLSSLIQVLVDNEIMQDNFIKSISVLKSAPERNKTYSVNQEVDILKYLETNEPILLLYIQFISYIFLRPVEVNRLKVGDLDIEGQKLFVRAKNKAVKVKIIPQKIIDLLPDLSTKNPEHYLFTPVEIGGVWEAEENNRRSHFSKKFKDVKEHFGLGINYGLYSFRHTAITNLYRELRKHKTPFEVKSILMNITGHQTMIALEKYLRDIDAELPEDYSNFLK